MNIEIEQKACPARPDTEASDCQFLRDFEEMSCFGATAGGGVERQAGSEGDKQVRQWFHNVLENMGAEVFYDSIGNQFGLFNLVKDAPYCGLGSHLDSQPQAGRYDGAYGVLAAAHAAARIKNAVEKGRFTPTHNLAVINWFNEEGSRFEPSMMGSSVYVGALPLEEALRTTDAQGISVAQAIAEANWFPQRAIPELEAYAEIHVEQGKILEQSGIDIGLVTGTWGARKFEVSIRGEQGHTGSTLMDDRKDALYAASLIISEVRHITQSYPHGVLQASVSKLLIEPNSPVTIAREAIFNIDLRSPDADVLESAHRRLDKILANAKNLSNTDICLHQTHSWNLNPYSAEGVKLARKVVSKLGYSCQEILTVAGHDSTNLKDHVPTIMLFIPSVDGISHNEAEYTEPRDCLRGLSVLTLVAKNFVC